MNIGLLLLTLSYTPKSPEGDLKKCFPELRGSELFVEEPEFYDYERSRRGLFVETSKYIRIIIYVYWNTNSPPWLDDCPNIFK